MDNMSRNNVGILKSIFEFLLEKEQQRPGSARVILERVFENNDVSLEAVFNYDDYHIWLLNRRIDSFHELLREFRDGEIEELYRFMN